MERTKFNIPDAINCSLETNYTQIPNELLRNPEISAKAKVILSILLSNQEGWHSCSTAILRMVKEGRDAVREALNELEDFGYLKRMQYRNRETKRICGLFWAYTNQPGEFNITKQTRELRINNMEVVDKHPQTEKPAAGLPAPENPPLIRPIYNNTKRDISLSPDFSEETNHTQSETRSKKPSIEERNEIYLPLAKKLSHIIRSKKNIKHTPHQLKQWSNDMRRLFEGNGVEFSRIEKAIDWYKENIGGEYIPVIESGESLRQKFEKVEAAMNRKKQGKIPKIKVYDGVRYTECEDGYYRTKSGEVWFD